MAGVLDRRCATCKIQMHHTRGMHVVTHDASYYFCSNKCKKGHNKVTHKARRAKRQSRISNVQSQPEVTQPDWLQLPGDVIWIVQSQLELWDLLSMGQTCRSWFSSMCPAIHSMVFPVSSDEHIWSRTVWLLQYMMPHVHTLALELPDFDLANEQLQTLSRCKQLQHLSVNIKGPSKVWCHMSYLWLPALARLTALQSLEVVAPHDSFLDIASLSSLTSLTSLQIISHNDGDTIYCHSFAEEQVQGLQQLPFLQALEYTDEMIPHLSISTLTSLTSLTIHNVDVQFSAHEPGGTTLPVVQPYMASYLKGIASLPCLRKLRLSTVKCNLHRWNDSTRAADLAAFTAAFITTCSKHLCQVPELELHISEYMKLEACPETFHSLAKLTSLTALTATFTDCDSSLNIAHLWPLRRLRQLSLSIYGFGAVRESNNQVWIWDRDLRALFQSLTQLTRLHLGLRPTWLLNPKGFMYLTHLTELKELRVTLPPDQYIEKAAEEVVLLPAGCLPASVVRAELEGFEIEVEGSCQMQRQESAAAAPVAAETPCKAPSAQPDAMEAVMSALQVT